MYATRDDLINRFGLDTLLMVADRDRDNVPDQELIDRELANASAEMDVFVGQRHRLPLDPVPPVLMPLCCDIALYRLSLDGGVTEERRKRYEDAMALLRLIARGEVSLGMPTEPEASSGEAEFFSEPVRFNRLL